jgi:hypothetical protein
MEGRILQRPDERDRGQVHSNVSAHEAQMAFPGEVQRAGGLRLEGRMTKLQAKLVALDMWKELASDGQLGKNQTKAWNKYNVRRLKGFCPLCEIYYVHQDEVCLPECPMGHCCESNGYSLETGGGCKPVREIPEDEASGGEQNEEDNNVPMG